MYYDGYETLRVLHRPRYDPHIKYIRWILACITMVTRHCVYYDRYVTDGTDDNDNQESKERSGRTQRLLQFLEARA